MAKQKKIINREISWLSFNDRVLQEAADPNVPLVERIRFLGIFSNNLDEFFKVRVANLKRMMDFDKGVKKIIGDKPKNVLAKIQQIVITQQNKFYKIYGEILIDLEINNIFIINEKQLNPVQSVFIKQFFDEKLLPVLTPIMLHNIETFPYLKDKSIYLAVKLTSKDPSISKEYALIEIPAGELSRFIVLPPVNNKKYIIILDDVIRYCLNDVFSIFNFDSFKAFTIKITRDAELDIDNDLSISFLEKISKGVSERKQGQPVRFVFDSSIPKDLLQFITTKMELDEDDNLIPGGRYHNYKDFINFPNIGSKNLEYKPLPPLPHKLIKPNKSILNVIAQQDLMLYNPYNKFSDYINLLREAAIDPKVTSIKITLYRVAKHSKVINALINAARNGKLVTVVIELQARFDEKSNIYWSKKLEEVGVTVLFGVPGLKVHSKTTLITRKEKKKLVHYATVGTGNFHEGNASVYSDVTLFTADKRITTDVIKLFNFYENIYRTYTYKHLLVSPLYMRRRLINLIDNEINNARNGKNAHIILKINNLVDKDMIKKLYQANNSGVKIALIIRGICSLIPGVPGMSENIKAVSIVDKYLEHARIFVFCNNNKELYYISSADWMTRNLDHRIEVVCPVYDPKLRKELKNILKFQLKDNVKSRIINQEQDNLYKAKKSKKTIRSQIETYKAIKNNSLN